MLGWLVLLTVLLNSARGAVSVSVPKPQACGLFEEFRRCGPAASCVPTCDNQGDEVCCVVGCTEGCFCVDGYIRDHNNKCVTMKNCPSAGLLKFEKLEIVILENAKMARLTVLRINGSHGQITVRWKVKTSNLAYSTLAGLVVFEDEITSQFIDIPVIDNNVRDSDITLEVVLFEPSPKTHVELRGGLTKIIIQDDDMRPGYPEMDKLSLSVKESDGVVSVRVVRVGGSDGLLTASWKTVGGTAQAESDFVEDSGQLEFKDGEVEHIIKIQINNDKVRETKEQFRVEILNPTVAPGVLNFRNLGSKLSTIVTIEDDDMTPGYPEMLTRELRVKENEGTVLIKVVRNGGADGTITVKYRISSGTAQYPLDFLRLAPEGYLVFAEGVTEQTISVIILDDSEREHEEMFQVELFEPSAGPGTLNFRNKGTTFVTNVIIVDNDMNGGKLVLEQSTIDVLENIGTINVAVNRVDGTDGQVLVRWRTSGEGSFFQASHGILIFEEGQSRKNIEIRIIDNEMRNREKRSFHVELFEPTAPAGVNFRGFGEVTRTTINVNDDDVDAGQLVISPNSSYSILNGVPTITVTILRVGGTDGRVFVKWRTVTSLTTLAHISGDIIFSEGESQKQIQIPRPLGDFTIELIDPRPELEGVRFRGLGEVAKVNINLSAFLGTLSIEESEYHVSENVGSLSIGIVRDGNAAVPIRVQWRLISRTAVEREDFEAEVKEIVFLPEQHLQFISIHIIDNSVREPDEFFEVELVSVITEEGAFVFNGLGAIKKTIVNIIDDDRRPGVFAFMDSSVIVSVGSNATLNVVRTEGTDGIVQLHWRTTDGDNTREGVDYNQVRGTLQFENGQTEQQFTIQILPGDGSGAERRFSIGLFDPSSGARLGSNSLITVIIRAEAKPRGPLIFFWNNTLEVPRDSESVLFQIRRTEDGLPQTFFLETLQYDGNGGALPKVDYRPIRGYLTFKPDLVALTSMVKLIPNPNNRALIKVLLLRISKADVGGIVPGGDFMTVILKDVGALSWKGPEVHQQTNAEVSGSVQTEVQQPSSPHLEFRGGAKVHEQKEIPKCPAGQTFKKCQPACQKKCGEGTPNVPHSCNLRGCIDGCFCPTGMLLNPASQKCVAPAHCPVSKCPPGLIFKECAPACPEVCPGLDFLDMPCHGSGCVKGCYCPHGLVLDNTLKNCVNPAHCPSGSQAASGRSLLSGGLPGGLPTGAVQGQVQSQGGGGLLGGLLSG